MIIYIIEINNIYFYLFLHGFKVLNPAKNAGFTAVLVWLCVKFMCLIVIFPISEGSKAFFGGYGVRSVLYIAKPFQA